MVIRVLPPDVAAKIAAGEVIERPVSVAKELLENAIDAGADDIRLEVLQGGRRLIRVSDNGCGIPAAEVDLAFARHATSKLTTAEDLFRIRTLGFRGEALTSIAAVSRLTLVTRATGEQTGTVIRLEGGALLGREPQGWVPGTMVQVEQLFFNTPARLKFLRSDTTEAGHIARLVSSYALAYPEKRFTLQHNDRLVLRTTGTGALLDVVVAIYGLDVAEAMLELPHAATGEAGVEVWGYIGAPSLHRKDRQDLVFFVNRRWVQDSTLAFAVGEAYRTLLPTGRHPLAVLNVSLLPDEVDVNIHPTKREVRFRRARDVFAHVQRAVRTTLMAQRPVPVVASVPGSSADWERRRGTGDLRYPGAEQTLQALDVYRPLGQTRSQGVATGQLIVRPEPSERLPMLRVVGQIAQSYIIAEGPGGMYLIDQHAAHERIRYEELRAQRADAGVTTQELLEPVAIDLTPQQATLLEGQLSVLEGFGLGISPFGGSTFLVRRVPANLAGRAIQAAITEMVQTAEEGGAEFAWEEGALVTISCHTAVRAGQTLGVDEMRDLVRKLEKSALPHTCPHGRPTMVHLSQAQLEKEFGRR